MGRGYRQCSRCLAPLRPRGTTPLRFCPRCGQALPEATEARPVLDTGPRTSAAAVLSFLLGVLALLSVGLAPLLGGAGLICGVIARERIGVSDGRLAGRGLAAVGMVMGVAAVLLFVLHRAPGCIVTP